MSFKWTRVVTMSTMFKSSYWWAERTSRAIPTLCDGDCKIGSTNFSLTTWMRHLGTLPMSMSISFTLNYISWSCAALFQFKLMFIIHKFNPYLHMNVETTFPWFTMCIERIIWYEFWAVQLIRMVKSNGDGHVHHQGRHLDSKHWLCIEYFMIWIIFYFQKFWQFYNLQFKQLFTFKSPLEVLWQ